MALFPDHPGEPVPEENFWTLWCKGRLTEADRHTIRLGTTPSRLTSAHLHHPPIFFLQAGCPSCHPTNSVKALKATSAFGLGRRHWSSTQRCYLHRLCTSGVTCTISLPFLIFANLIDIWLEVIWSEVFDVQYFFNIVLVTHLFSSWFVGIVWQKDNTCNRKVSEELNAD